jgi:hypothetical protein
MGGVSLDDFVERQLKMIAECEIEHGLTCPNNVAGMVD